MPTPAATPTAAAVQAAGCVDGTHAQEGAQGAVHAGPLADNAAYWRQPKGTKLWVGSTRQQPPTTAIIHAGRVDANRVDGVHQVRESTATVPDLALFYPGLLRLPDPGRWRLTVTIGADRACFLVDVR